MLDILSPFIAIYGLVLLLRSDKIGYFFAGFFIGIFWFFWLSLSSIYFGLSFIVPFEILIIALIYGLLFRICYIFKFDLLRLAAVFCLTYIHPLGFDWLNWGVLVVPGLFECSLKGVICLFLIAYFYYERYISRYYKIAIILVIFYFGLQKDEPKFERLNLNYELVQTQISQEQKFLALNMQKNADDLVALIKRAIDAKKELVILPESAFAFDLERDFEGRYYAILQELSYQIDIVAGAFSSKDSAVFNSTFVFSKGKDTILNKHYLVPFGEEIPFFKDFFKEYLLNLGEFTRGAPLNTYELKGQKITNAICYEATKEELFKHSSIIIAISNNAWFDGFVEPNLQRQLIKFYASKHGVSVYHATNGNYTATITPKYPIIKTLHADFLKLYERLKTWAQTF